MTKGHRTMHRVIPAIAALGFLLPALPARADLTLLDQFDPAFAGGLCGVAFDPETQTVWLHACSGSDVQAYTTAGGFLRSLARPGESANDVDVEVAPEELTLAETVVPAGTLLFINGETGAAEIYAMDPLTGAVLDTLVTAFGTSHVVGGAYHRQRNTFFLVQDRVPAAANRNRIAEIDPVTGEVLNTFQIGAVYDVNFGDLEICAASGNLLVVSSIESGVAEFTPDGAFLQVRPLPAGVASLSGIGTDEAASEAWVSGTGGVVWRLGGVQCAVVAVEGGASDGVALGPARPNPSRGTVTIHYSLATESTVTIDVYDVSGRKVRSLVSGPVPAGAHEVVWDARDDEGKRLGFGVYFYRMRADRWVGQKKVVLLDR